MKPSRGFAALVVATALAVLFAATCPQVASAQTLTYQIANSRDDSSGGASGYSAAGLMWPYTNNTQPSFLRWPIQVPPTATITSAYIQVTCSDALDSNPSTATVTLIDTDNCPGFDLTSPNTLPLTASSVNSPVTSWPAGQWYQSANMAALVQQYVARPGYSPGNYIGFCIGNASGTWKRYYAYDASPVRAAKLIINYTGGNALIDLWMADPEVRLGQKIYCQIVNANPTDRLQASLDSQVFYTKSGSLQVEEIVTANYRTLLAGSHNLTVQVISAGGVVRGTASRTWAKLHDGIGAVGIDENNAICRQGVPFFPVTTWLQDPLELSPWAGSVNTLFGLGSLYSLTAAGFGNFLDDAMVPNLPAIGPSKGNYWPGGQTSNISESGSTVNYAQSVDITALSNYVTTNLNRPALLMWDWMDEPDSGGSTQYIPPSEIRRWTDTCHQLDTQHPHIVNLTGEGFGQVPQPNWNQERSQAYCFLYDDQMNATFGTTTFPFAKKTPVADMIGMDIYPYEYATYFTWLNLETWLAAIDNLEQWNYHLIPCFTWIETTDIEPQGSTSYPWTPGPTAPQVTNLIWGAIIHDCKGLGLFYYFTPTPTANIAAIRTAMAQITALTPVILGPETVSTSVNCTYPNDGSRVDMMTRQYAAQLYIFATTASTAGNLSTTASFEVAGLTAGQFVQVYSESRAVISQNGYFADTFAPYGVHIYVLGSGAGTPGVPDPQLCSLTATTPLLSNGLQQSTITITVRDGYDAPVVGEPPANIVVTVTGSGGGNVLIQPATATDANGQTVAYLSTTVPTTKIVSVAVRGTTLTGVAQVECVALPIVLAYSGADLTQVVPGTTTGGTMTITCRDILGARNLWTLDVFRWTASTQVNDPQVKFESFVDLTGSGSFNYAVAGGNGLFQAHLPPANGLDINSYTELHKDVDYFAFSLTEHTTGYDIVTTYRINPSTPAGTNFTATRTVTNKQTTVLVPTQYMSSYLILNDGGYNPRLGTGQLSGYIYGGSVQHQQMLPGGADALWLTTDNLDRAANAAFSASSTLWAQAVVLNNAITQGLGLVAGRAFKLTTGIVAYYPASSIGNVTFDPRAYYLDGIHFDATPMEWLGSNRAANAAGIPVNGSATVNFNLAINIQSASAFGISVGLAPDQNWVYQNTPLTTLDRHVLALTVSVTTDTWGNNFYATTVTQSGAGVVTPTQTRSAGTLVKPATTAAWTVPAGGNLSGYLVGGRVQGQGLVGSAANQAVTGSCTVTVTVLGDQSGQSYPATATLTINVRPLGAIDGTGQVNRSDLTILDDRLNAFGIAPQTDADCDLSGNGAVTAADRVILNKILNVQPVP